MPTFVAFLRDIESPFEVKDYVRMYLGKLTLLLTIIPDSLPPFLVSSVIIQVSRVSVVIFD